MYIFSGHQDESDYSNKPRFLGRSVLLNNQDHLWKHEEPLALKNLGVATLSTLDTISTVCFANRLLITPQPTTRKYSCKNWAKNWHI